jgi:hypothetical protein
MKQMLQRKSGSRGTSPALTKQGALRPAVRISARYSSRSACQRSVHSADSISPQTRPAVGPAEDHYEREAERVAQRVVNMREPSPVVAPTLHSSTSLQRKCACGGSSEEECSCAKKGSSLQRAEAGPNAPVTAPPIVHQVLATPGRPLSSEIRAYMEPRFGHDFSGVRVHTDSYAAESAGAVNALAYTVGRNIAFASGQYSTSSDFGRRLLAHELAHVVQQGGAGSVHNWNAGTASVGGIVQRQDAGTPPQTPTKTPAQMPAQKSPASTPGSGGLCADHPNEAYYQNNPSFCRDTSGSGALHSGHTCYREIPSGSGCPPGKHICFTDGKCDEKESHIDSTAPSISRDAQGLCDLSWFGLCSLEHGVLDVIPGLVTEAAQAQADAQEQCMKSCETLPWYAKGFCMSGCSPGPM